VASRRPIEPLPSHLFHRPSHFAEAALRASKPARRQAAILGLGLDGDDGHTRLSRGSNFVLYGGSEETHAKMQETAVKVNEQLDKRGKRLEDVSHAELRDIFHDATA
jgi:hypothetical protein